jgi:ferredoxin
MRVEVDRDLCIGSGNCVHLSGGAIELDDEGVATVVNGESASVEKLRQAERSCPTEAIAVTVDGA